MDAKAELEKEKSFIEEELASFFDDIERSSMDDPLALDLLSSIEEFTMRPAKRVRSILVVMGYRAVGGKDLEKARKAAISLELIQSMLLIHDDIMDRSDLRRGRPSFHELYRMRHEGSGHMGSSVDFGTNMALIAGDLAESLGEKALLISGFEPEKVQRALMTQCDMIKDTGFGQMLDLYSETLENWSEEMVQKVQENKTARYTFDAPLLIGAQLHGVSEEQRKALSGFAIPVGIAFQIIDDILGFFGDPKRGGRSDLSDIKEGKRTLLIVKALELVDEKDRKEIMNALGNDKLTLEEAERVREIIRSCGSEDYSRKRAREMTEMGLGSLQDADIDADVVDFLIGFTEYLMQRA